MSLTVTLILAAVSLAAAGLCGWLGARPAKPLSPPRLAPWRLLMLVFFAVGVTALGHLVAIWKAS
ncbi:MAG TPA: hypothetical protein VGF42_00800 [Caulobacteraceae bacterium]